MIKSTISFNKTLGLLIFYFIFLFGCKSQEDERKEKLLKLLQDKRGFEMTLKTFTFKGEKGRSMENFIKMEIDKVQYSIDSLMLINQLEK